MVRLTKKLGLIVSVAWLLTGVPASTFADDPASFVPPRVKPLTVRSFFKGSLRFDDYRREPVSFAFSPDAGYLAGTTGGDVQLWDVSTGKHFGRLDGDRGDGAATAFAPDGKTLITSSWRSCAGLCCFRSPQSRAGVRHFSIRAQDRLVYYNQWSCFNSRCMTRARLVVC